MIFVEFTGHLCESCSIKRVFVNPLHVNKVCEQEFYNGEGHHQKTVIYCTDSSPVSVEESVDQVIAKLQYHTKRGQ